MPRMAYTQPMNKQQKHNASKTQEVNLIKLSADVHKHNFKICRQVDGLNIQPAQVFEPEEAFTWALKQLESAQRVVFCYEAGFSGFSLARRLRAAGVEPVVMHPQNLDERCRRVSTDKRDARAIGGRLDRYLAGNEEALVKVRIPGEEEEDQRAESRQRAQFMKIRKQVEAQGRSLLTFKGLPCPEGWWRCDESGWQITIQMHRWPAPIVSLLEGYRATALFMEKKIVALTRKIEAAAQAHLPASMPVLPHGFGELSVEVLRREVCNWDRFHNRGQVGSFFGLCAAESTSGEQQIQGSITKTGNPRARYCLIEMAWRVLAFQPDYWVVKKFRARMDRTKPRSVARKKLIVAMARLIGVDLWRLYTGQTTMAKLGLVPRRGKVYELKEPHLEEPAQGPAGPKTPPPSGRTRGKKTPPIQS
jgi:transposase